MMKDVGILSHETCFMSSGAVVLNQLCANSCHSPHECSHNARKDGHHLLQDIMPCCAVVPCLHLLLF